MLHQITADVDFDANMKATFLETGHLYRKGCEKAT